MYKKPVYELEIIANVYEGGRANKNWYRMMPSTDIQLLAEAKEFMGTRCKLIYEQLLGAQDKEYSIDLPERVVGSMILPGSISLRQEVEYA